MCWRLLLLLSFEALAHAFLVPSGLSPAPSVVGATHRRLSRTSLAFIPSSWKLADATTVRMTANLHDPATRDAQYSDNMAQYLVDLHDSKAVFDFCGGMMFQLELSQKLRNHLANVAKDGRCSLQPFVFDRATDRMAKMPGYSRDANADNVKLFHGREVRQVPTAAGGMGFVLQLSLAGDDPEGWTPQELAGYDGWGHDSHRTWRNAERLESEGFTTFRSKFGSSAFALHHRFYLHLDRDNQLWLSAEDGCEGCPA